MKAIKYIAIAAAVLMLASCSNKELDSVQQRRDNAMKPLEFTTVVQNQTRAGQIYSTNLSKLYMSIVGTFYSAAGQEVVNPSLELTKGEQGWSYIYNGSDTNTVLYWPLEGMEGVEFRAWYYDGDSAPARGVLDNKTATLDAVGAFTSMDYTSGAQAVPLSMYHAVSRAEFKAKVLTKSADGPYKIKVDVKGVSLHNMAYKASAYVLPESEAPMGAFTLAEGTRALLAEPESHSFLTQSSEAAAIGSLFVMPQEIDAQDLSANTWNKPYISILAQIRVDEGENTVPIFPKNAGVDDYAWLAVPLPSDFEGFQAHHKYIFTINLRDDAMGKADKDQYPNKDEEEGPKGEDAEDIVPEEDRGDDITLEGRSAFSVNVSVEDVFDFDEYGNIDVNLPPPGIIKSKFTVNSDGDQVYFSQGMLQYIGSAGNGDAAAGNSGAYWKFADNQLQRLANNGQYSTKVKQDRDLFSWGTSGYNHGAVSYQPWARDGQYDNANYYAYGDKTLNLNDGNGQADWGYNAIRNGGDKENIGWRSLTYTECSYIFYTRSTPSGVRFVKAQINGINGLLLLPDDWSTEYYTLNYPNQGNKNYNVNVISLDNWNNAVEPHGAVFLPVTGLLTGTSMAYATTTGCYRLATHSTDGYSYSIRINTANGDIQSLVRSQGHSVRLVYPVLK